MFQKLTKLTTALALSTAVAVPAFAELSGTLRITSDMANPAPRAVMEKMASDFDAMHPNLSVELTVVDREAWKTQI
ncbi:MAG: carbohydrate ABC transporter substrate-binding protein, partial [Rhodobacteraceae bacterium]|nr:carbohydrate ABC transporter substrate-binding protein [Paracoccaceae bacterium]